MIRWLPAAVLFLVIAACGDATATPPPPSPTFNVIVRPSTPALIVTPTRATPIPWPTRQQDTAPWVEERVDAVVALYQPTRAGEALLRSLDLRQMEGDPGFFGSYGFSEWAGVGEASPIGAMHELGHETLEFAAAFLSGGETRTILTGLIRRAFGLP